MSVERRLGALAIATMLAVTSSPESVIGEEIINKNPLVTPDSVVGEGEMKSQEEICLKDQKEMKINQKYGNFLNGEGVYSDEKLKELFYQTPTGSLVDLGFLEAYGSECLIQSVILSNENIEGNQFLAIGLKNKSGERSIVVVKWPIRNFFEISPRVYIGESIGSSSKSIKLNNEEEVDSFFNKSDDRMYRFQFFYEDVGSDSSLFQGKQLVELYNSIYLPSISANREFLADIYIPMDMKDVGQTGVEMINSFGSGKLVEINSYLEFQEVVKNNDSIPVVFGINYKNR